MSTLININHLGSPFQISGLSLSPIGAMPATRMKPDPCSPSGESQGLASECSVQSRCPLNQMWNLNLFPNWVMQTCRAPGLTFSIRVPSVQSTHGRTRGVLAGFHLHHMSMIYAAASAGPGNTSPVCYLPYWPSLACHFPRFPFWGCFKFPLGPRLSINQCQSMDSDYLIWMWNPEIWTSGVLIGSIFLSTASTSTCTGMTLAHVNIWTVCNSELWTFNWRT